MSDDPLVFRNTNDPTFVYFDTAPSFGIFGGAIQIELASRILLPNNGNVTTEFVINAHLRCSPQAAADLRNALDKALQMLVETESPTVAANQLN